MVFPFFLWDLKVFSSSSYVPEGGGEKKKKNHADSQEKNQFFFFLEALKSLFFGVCLAVFDGWRNKCWVNASDVSTCAAV